jgi:hypothetical protein
MQITSADIVSMCTKLGALSPNQAGLQSSDFLNIANLVTMVLTAELNGSREEYLIYTDAIPVVVGQSHYRIPYRALNSTIRHLWFEYTDSRYRLFPKEIEFIDAYGVNFQGQPDSFYLQGNDIVLLPTPSIAGTLQVAYPMRPNLLVDVTTCQQAISISGNTVTVANIPLNFVSGIKYDVVDNMSGNSVVLYDLVGTVNTSNKTISFPADLSKVQPGFWICQAGQTPTPNLPEEGHPLLLESCILRVEMLRGNKTRIANSSAIVADARKAWDRLLNNRVVSKPHAAGTGGPQMPVRPW